MNLYDFNGAKAVRTSKYANSKSDGMIIVEENLQITPSDVKIIV